MTNENLMWIAGLLEGEGCFTSNKYGTPARLFGKEAQELMLLILPFMGQRRSNKISKILAL